MNVRGDHQYGGGGQLQTSTYNPEGGMYAGSSQGN